MGWFVRSNWSDYQCDATKGGPWPVETVARLCAIGLLGIHPDRPDEARITRDGAALLRLSKRVAAQASDTAGGYGAKRSEPNPQAPSEEGGER